MPLCTLHIGLPKSGSTSVQSTIFANRARLAKLGIYVPEASTSGYRRADHHLLAWDILGRTTHAGIEGSLEALKAELARRTPEHVLITSEYFQEQMHRVSYLESLRDLFAGLGYRLRLIAYVRPQPDYINSNYAQNVKLLLNKLGINTYVERALKLRRFDYTRLLLPSLGVKDIEIVYRPFNQEVLARGISHDFLATLGLDQRAIAGMEIPPMENISPGPKTLALCLAISRRLEKRNIVLDDDARNRASRVLQDMGGHMGWNATRFTGISKLNARRMQLRFAAGNDEFAAAAWSIRWTDVFGQACWTPPPYNAFHPKKASPADKDEFKDAIDTAWKLLKFGKYDAQTPVAPMRSVSSAS